MVVRFLGVLKYDTESFIGVTLDGRSGWIFLLGIVLFVAFIFDEVGTVAR